DICGWWRYQSRVVNMMLLVMTILFLRGRRDASI
ncbi:hypothetical protein HMPREF1167_00162, partial [Aeromonas veronii AER39]